MLKRYPIDVLPELVQEGDTISVAHRAKHGVTISSRGHVHRIDAHGHLRIFVTKEGGAIGRYEVGKPTSDRFTLLERSGLPQAELALFG